MQILIDGDGCPVVPLTCEIAAKYKLPVLLFFDTAHAPTSLPSEVEIYTVAKGRDSVDMALIQRLKKGDVVITQDYGLAALVLSRGAFCLRQDGFCYTNGNIDQLLMSRYLHQKVRAAGGRMKGPKKRQPEEDLAFRQSLERLLMPLLSKENE